MRAVVPFCSISIAILAGAVLWPPDPVLAEQAAKATPVRAAWGAPEGAKCLGIGPGVA
jgi:hypothetical protein